MDGGRYDMYVHTSTDTHDLTRHWCESRDEISLVDSDPAALSPGQSSFGHIVGYALVFVSFISFFFFLILVNLTTSLLLTFDLFLVGMM
jgi:hypothetical protein